MPLVLTSGGSNLLSITALELLAIRLGSRGDIVASHVKVACFMETKIANSPN